MNTPQIMAIEAAIELLSMTRGEVAREHQGVLVAMLKHGEQSSSEALRQAVSIEAEQLLACVERTNEDMQAIGKAAAAHRWHLAYKNSSLTTADASSVLLRTATKLQRLAKGHK